MTPLQHLNDDFARLEQLESVHTFLIKNVTCAIDTSDLLRAEYVQIISALDHYIHDLTLKKMLEIFAGTRNPTNSFQKFPLPMSLALQISDLQTSVSVPGLTSVALFEQEVRTKHSFLSFQHPDKIAEAIRLFSDIRLWDELAKLKNTDAKLLKQKLTNIVDRRNKIAHESDKKPGFPIELWPIDRTMVNDTKKFVLELCYSINSLVG